MLQEPWRQCRGCNQFDKSMEFQIVYIFLWKRKCFLAIFHGKWPEKLTILYIFQNFERSTNGFSRPSFMRVFSMTKGGFINWSKVNVSFGVLGLS